MKEKSYILREQTKPIQKPTPAYNAEQSSVSHIRLFLFIYRVYR